MSATYMARRVGRIAADRRWGGGLRREHLIELLGCDRREAGRAIGIAAHWRAIDFCEGWIVAPPTAAPLERAA